ncbi:hypothetical protein Cni_G21496 [Canna indica]|uniref:J domain-containing protein n=1 Tax=Canna indica TaxID=4628 RepID=A0AAQ3KQ15_9LILI|nr:hypothetical protein Cni_G21496 [Canna indica]
MPPPSAFRSVEMHAASVLQNVLRSRELSQLLPLVHCALVHSSPVFLARRSSDRSDSVNHIRFSVRQKRSDAKEALKNLYFNETSSKKYSLDEDIAWHATRKSSRDVGVEDKSGESNKSQRSKTTAKWKQQRVSDVRKGKHRKNRSRSYGQSFEDDDYEHPYKKFSAGFGGQRGFTWSFSSEEKLHFENIPNGFEWKDDSQQAKYRRKVWSESDIEEESTDVNLQSYKLVLGLPAMGPLTLDDVKSAFHASALKWHPDKHQGPLKAAAEEKFKACVDAYKSLSTALKSN